MKQILLLIYLLTCIGCTKKFVTRYCGPGKTNPVIIFKKQDNNLPSFVKERNILIKSTIDILEKLKLSDLNIETQKKVISFRDKINNATSRNNDLMASALSAYIIRPCDQNVSANYFNILNKIADDLPKITELENSLKSIVSKTNFEIM